MHQCIGSSAGYRIAVGPQVGRKALVLRPITPLIGTARGSERRWRTAFPGTPA